MERRSREREPLGVGVCGAHLSKATKDGATSLVVAQRWASPLLCLKGLAGLTEIIMFAFEAIPT
jgi:hypothetical protein